MTKERLAEIQAAMREPSFPEVYKAYFQPVIVELGRVFDDVERLRAENERLNAWLTHIKNTGDEFGFIAEEALDGTPFEPEPTS
ncbi:MAG: hypothetical protein WC822_01110 [Candidatus Paceibacterota bacterium]|jgi:hypothetical protein